MADPGMPVPADFDEPLRLALQTEIVGKFHQQGVDDVLSYFNQGLSGVLYRFAACAGHDEAYTANVNAHGNSPGFPERFHQECALFDFFVSGQSSLECLCFALHAVGTLIDPAAFPMATEANLRQVTPEKTRERYVAAFAGQQISQSLDQVISSIEFVEWKGTRNLLSHRVHPGRVFNQGAPPAVPPVVWTGIAINANTTHQRRTWLAARITELLQETHGFAAVLP